MGLDNFLNDLITEVDTTKFSILDVLGYRMEHTPDETAFIFLKDGENEEEIVTYRQLGNTAASLAVKMAEMNVTGKRALLLFPPGMEFVYSLFGCFFASVIAVPAYPPRKNRSLDRIKKIVSDSEATIVLTTKEIFESFNRSFKDVTELQNLEWVIFQQTSCPVSVVKFPNPEDVALLQYTSGSTGNPKGVMITHRNIMRNCEFIRQSFGFSRKTVAISWLPTFHDMGLVGQVFQPVYTGFQSVLISPVAFFQKPARWLNAFTKYKGTMGGAPNFAYDLLSEIPEEERKDLDLSSIQTIYCGAEPIRKSTFDKFVETYKYHGLKPEMLYPCYGMAETTLITSGPPAGRGAVYLSVSGSALLQNKVKVVQENDEDAKNLVGVGYPWLDTTVRIMNPETLLPSRDDEVGEIWVNGSSVAPGYWNNPDETERMFKAHIPGDPLTNYLRTGDLGFFHNGELFISGRIKDLIIIHGLNVYPQDIEFIVEKAHPAIRSNACAAFSVEKDGEEKLVVIAEVERSAIIGLDVNAVCDTIREDIAVETELVVHAIFLLRTSTILKTSSGKIQRSACRDAFLDNKLNVIGESLLENLFHINEQDSSPVDIINMEAWLMTWIHNNLKVPLNRIDASRPITSYGLTSMKAIVLQQDFLDKYGESFPPYLFFEKGSLRQLCEKAMMILREN